MPKLVISLLVSVLARLVTERIDIISITSPERANP